MICTAAGCSKDAVTFHGVSTVTHGYCDEHRCCANCGGRLMGDKPCCDHPKERPNALRDAAPDMLEALKDVWDAGVFECCCGAPGGACDGTCTHTRVKMAIIKAGGKL
jgi:hypothetical protein